MAERVLVIGATGQLGRHFVHALRQEGRHVVMLVRSAVSSGTAEDRQAVIDLLAAQGAVPLEGSLEDKAVLERACAEVDAIVSCIDHRPDHLGLQSVLAEAAAKSGRVKRIMPSQFGMDSRVYLQGKVDHGDTKRQLQQVFDSCGVPVTYVHVNGLATYWAASLGQLGLKEPPREEVEVYGDGNIKFSMVTPEDVGRYGARALFDDTTTNRHTLISPPTNRLSQNELIAMWESQTGVKLRRRTISAREMDEKIAAVKGKPDKFVQLSFLQLIQAAWIDGLGDGRRRPDVLELTELYPDLGYETISQYLRRFLPVAEAAE
jgi:uncharacterized protein YbjT (DUF2867 family)